MDYSPNGEDCFLASPAFVDLTGQAKAGDVGPKGGMAPHHHLVPEGKQSDLVKPEAPGHPYTRGGHN